MLSCLFNSGFFSVSPNYYYLIKSQLFPLIFYQIDCSWTLLCSNETRSMFTNIELGSKEVALLSNTITSYLGHDLIKLT